MKRLLSTLLLMSCTLGLGAAPALAAGDCWLITDGKGRGAVLITDQVGSLVVLPADNPLTKAAGTITVGNFTDCSGPAHWHGSLFLKADPKNGLKCGWGHCQKIVPGTALANDFVDMTKLVFKTADTVMTMQLACNGAQTIQDMCDAVDKIDAMKTKIDTAVTNTTITARQGRDLKELADKVKKSLVKAKDLVKDLVDNPPKNLSDMLTKGKQYKQDGEKALKDLKKFMAKLIAAGLI